MLRCELIARNLYPATIVPDQPSYRVLSHCCAFRAPAPDWSSPVAMFALKFCLFKLPRLTVFLISILCPEFINFHRLKYLGNAW